MDRFTSFFASRPRQAIAWAVLGVLGVGLVAAGVVLLTGDDSGSPPVSVGTEGRFVPAPPTPTATPTASPQGSPGASPSPSPSPSESPSPSPTATAARTQTQQTGGSSGGGGAPTPTPEPPTPTPTAAGGGTVYCAPTGGSSPPLAIFGALRIKGVDAPAGTRISLAFDGVIGTTVSTTVPGGYRFFYTAGGPDCINRAGSAISVVVEGRSFPTGEVAGSSAPGVSFSIDVN